MIEEDVRFTFRFLGHEHETEVRLIDPRGRETPRSAFVHSEDEFVEACRAAEGTFNVYAGINERRAGGTKAEDVVRVCGIIYDADPIRPDTKEAATDEEMALAIAFGRQLQARRREQGVQCLLAESGNGAQLWAKADLREDLRRVEAAIQEHQRRTAATAPAGVRLDNIGDLPRIIKVIGTLSIKGSGTLPRPHRLSRWLDPKVVPPVSGSFMAALRRYDPPTKSAPVDTAAARLAPDEVRRIVGELGPKALLLFEGRQAEVLNHSGKPYASRNEAESALATICAIHGLEPGVTSAVLASSRIGKWATRGESYHQSILKGAYANLPAPAHAVVDPDVLREFRSGSRRARMVVEPDDLAEFRGGADA